MASTGGSAPKRRHESGLRAPRGPAAAHSRVDDRAEAQLRRGRSRNGFRTCDDAARLRERLAAGPRRVLVIGAGFIGSEVASACRELGLAVTVADRGEAPLVGALGGVIGRIAAQMHRDHGVDLRTGVSVTSLEGDADGRLRRVSLSDGSRLDVDVAVTALGSVRGTRR